MKLVFFRHGIASSKSPSDTDMDDFLRELTDEGIIETKEMSRNLGFIYKEIDVLFTSPLLRAVQTAGIIYNEFPKMKFELMPSLDKLCDPQTFVKEALRLDIAKNYCFVGHEPHLSAVVKFLLHESPEPKMILPKSGLVMLEGESFKDLKMTALIPPMFVRKINS